MFLHYYGLREQPFGVTPDPRYLYQSAIHREALASLVYGIEADLGFTSLIADPGMGKTTLLYYLLSRYGSSARTAFLFETQLNSRQLLRSLLSELDIDADTQDVVNLRNRLKHFLVAQAQMRRRVLIIIDEAQNLKRQVLETVRLLSNFETSQNKLLHIILAGQPQLGDKLAGSDLKQLRQRISMFVRLSPFSDEDTQAYINHRLRIAGYTGAPLFTPEANEVLAEKTGGVPREINRLCFAALSLGYALGRKSLDAELVQEASLELTPDAPESLPASTERLEATEDGRIVETARSSNELSREYLNHQSPPASFVLFAPPPNDLGPQSPDPYRETVAKQTAETSSPLQRPELTANSVPSLAGTLQFGDAGECRLLSSALLSGTIPPSARFRLTHVAVYGMLYPALILALLYLGTHYDWLRQALFTRP